MKHAFLLSCLLGLASVTSCVTEPDASYEKLGLKVPPAWAERAASKPVADTNWVRSFNDAKLQTLVDKALEENKDLKSTAARIKQSRAQAEIEGAPRKPQVDARLDDRRSQRSFIGFPGGVGGRSSLSNTHELTFNLSWELDLWGRVAAAKSAALADLQASEADYNAAQLSIASQAARGWFNYTAAQEQTDLAERALEVFKQSEEIVRSEFEGGVGQGNAAAELQLALADIETGKASLEQRREEQMRAGKLLEVILGRYPSSNLKAGAKLPSMPKSPPAGVPSDLLDRRPDIRVAERRLAASDKRIVQAKRSLLPAISLTGQYGTSTEDLAEILNSDFTIWSIASRVAQPVLDGNRLRQTVRLREAEAEAAVANLQQTALTAFREVEEALAADQYLSKRQEALQNAVERNRGALAQAKDDYVGGVGEVDTVLRAQQQLIQAESTLIEVRRARLENRVDLHVALGGDFWNRKPLTVVKD